MSRFVVLLALLVAGCGKSEPPKEAAPLPRLEAYLPKFQVLFPWSHPNAKTYKDKVVPHDKFGRYRLESIDGSITEGALTPIQYLKLKEVNWDWQYLLGNQSGTLTYQVEGWPARPSHELSSVTVSNGLYDGVQYLFRRSGSIRMFTWKQGKKNGPHVEWICSRDKKLQVILAHDFTDNTPDNSYQRWHLHKRTYERIKDPGQNCLHKISIPTTTIELWQSKWTYALKKGGYPLQFNTDANTNETTGFIARVKDTLDYLETNRIKNLPPPSPLHPWVGSHHPTETVSVSQP